MYTAILVQKIKKLQKFGQVCILLYVSKFLQEIFDEPNYCWQNLREKEA
jgi:hypothetical protein